MLLISKNSFVIAIVSSVIFVSSIKAETNYGLPDVWHFPSSSQGAVDATMRSPLYPSSNDKVTFYQGLCKKDDVNQTKGSLIVRVGKGPWKAISAPNYRWALDHDTHGSLSQIWGTQIKLPATSGATLEYYFKLEFENDKTVFLGNDNIPSTNEGIVQTKPFSFKILPPKPQLIVNEKDGNFSNTTFFIDENKDKKFPTIDISFRLPPDTKLDDANNAEVEVYTNLNNRDKVDQDQNKDGIEDGIIPPPRDSITKETKNSYWQAFPMEKKEDGTYTLSLPVTKTGAYRLTVRYRLEPNSPWVYIDSLGIRDHAIVVGPKKAQDMRLYELNIALANASSPTYRDRGTIEELTEASNKINLEWIKKLNSNWLWLQPVFPIGIEEREKDPLTKEPYEPGSPYCIRNYWEINPLLSGKYDPYLPNPISNTENYNQAMKSFRDFVSDSDKSGINIMLDMPFNHTAPDVVLGDAGVTIFGSKTNPLNPNDQIKDKVPGFFSSKSSEGVEAYSQPAKTTKDIAVSPDRTDFGKWGDVIDVYYGDYSSLAKGNPRPKQSAVIAKDEKDFLDTNSINKTTQGVWRYFGEVLPYWIKRSGHRGFNSTPEDGENRETLDSQGIDGLRKDFSQGLPPQAIEFIINKALKTKWNFVFMAENMDGGRATQKTTHQFPLLNEGVVYDIKKSQNSSEFMQTIKEREDRYNNTLVLLNTSSHDELPDNDPWDSIIRYAVLSTTAGTPMILYGQEIGAGRKMKEDSPQGSFDWYELNFEKEIPNFKRFNSMQSQWDGYNENKYGVRHLIPSYRAINLARAQSKALKSQFSYPLLPVGKKEPNPQIYSVAKSSNPKTILSLQDVVLCFVNLDRNENQSATYNIPSNIAKELGIVNSRSYNSKNIAPYVAENNPEAKGLDKWAWNKDLTTAELVNSGFLVSLNKVPTQEIDWVIKPYQAQFLKLYDVTAPRSKVENIRVILPTEEKPSLTVVWDPAKAEVGVRPDYEVTFLSNKKPIRTLFTTQPGIRLKSVDFKGDMTVQVRTVNPYKRENKSPVVAESEEFKL